MAIVASVWVLLCGKASVPVILAPTRWCCLGAGMTLSHSALMSVWQAILLTFQKHGDRISGLGSDLAQVSWCLSGHLRVQAQDSYSKPRASPPPILL